ncbi:MAG: MBL fold metallo-hydrolase [Phycisphaerales bacterium]|jgi:phosphoribosyl 1,2-cyclic phosphate phosphodiesterase|nr:MBL fold metallo-hydrolase [Phycisphaerales bacterium]
MITDVRCIVLGSGTSAGVPAIGCDCQTCTSDDPRDTRLRTSAAVCWTDPEGAPRTILIDASPDLRQQVLGAGITRCDGIFFTHNHVDHTFGLDEVRRFNIAQQAPIDIWAEPHTLEHLSRVYRHIFHPQHNVNDSFIAAVEPHTLSPGEPVELFGLRVEPLRLMHGNLPILGFRFEADDGPDWPLPLAWCTDVSTIPEASRARLGGLETLFLDMLRERPHGTHLSTQEAIREAYALGARRTWFVHMAHQIKHAEVDDALPEGMALAWDGLTVDWTG